MGLSNYQLVLLDNLIYLKTVPLLYEKWKEEGKEEGKSYTIKSLIDDLKEDDYKKSGISDNCCEMSLNEWMGILNAIEKDSVLRNLEIHDVQDNNSDENKSDNGFRAMTLVGTDENIIIFRGTTCGQEWIDNGQGGYSEITENQKDALEYVNNTDLVNNNPFVVSRHSKGGNLAQYVTLFATETLIDRCLNFDGQGFSEELCSTSKYQKALELNGDKLYTIASANDPVNVLLNAAVPEEHRMYIAANPEEGIGKPHLFHKNNNILSYDEKGNVQGFNEPAAISPLTYLLNDFVQYVKKNITAEEKRIIFDGL